MTSSELENIGADAVKRIYITTVLLGLAACSSNLMDSNQTQLRKSSDRTLAAFLPDVYSSIGQSDKNGALVIIDEGTAATHLVQSEEDVTPAAITSMTPTSQCYFVYAREAAIPPQVLSCRSLADGAQARLRTSQEIHALQRQLVAAETDARQREQVTAKVRQDLVAIRNTMKEYDDALAVNLRLGVINTNTLNTHDEAITSLQEGSSQITKDLRGVNTEILQIKRIVSEAARRLEQVADELSR